MSKYSEERSQQLHQFSLLLDIMDELREKCPWDNKQTLESLSSLTIEETFEAVEAIRNKDMNELEEELGDLFLHLVFYAKIGTELKHFSLNSILSRICDKLIRRHPHIYDDKHTSLTENQVKENWEKLKLNEGKKSILQGVPNSLPSLIKAHRIQDKVAAIGFDFSNTKEALKKVSEEVEEIIKETDSEKIKEEFGDLLFSLVNVSRHMNINADEALNYANNKFKNRFEWMENKALNEVDRIEQKSNREFLERLWNESKKIYP